MGVSILGKDVSLVSSIAGKAKANIGSVGGIGGWNGGGGGTWTLAFNDVSGILSGQTNTQTIPENTTLYFEWTLISQGGTQWTIWNQTTNTSYPYITGNGELFTTLNFNTNDIIYFVFISTIFDGIMTIKENNSLGRLIDEFNVTITD